MQRALIDVVFHPDRENNRPARGRTHEDKRSDGASIDRRIDMPWRVMAHDGHLTR
jgi:hypothetical protein